MRGCQFGFIDVWKKVGVISDGNTCEEDLVDGDEDVQDVGSVVSHEDGANEEEETKDDEVNDLRKTKKEARND